MNKFSFTLLLLSFLFITSVYAQNQDCNASEFLDPIPEGTIASNTGTECGFIPVGESFYINQCSPCGRKISDDDCLLTPNNSLCDVNGFQSTTGGFSDDAEWVRDPITLEDIMPLQALAFGFCNGLGTIENNFWVGFTAQTNEVCIEVCIGTCSRNDGIQAAIVETNCIDEFNTMEGPNPCTATGISAGEC